MKRTIWITGGLIGVAVLVLAVLPWFVDLSRYQEHWLPLVESALGRRVEVGTVRLTVLTGLGVRVNDLVVHEDPRFGTTPALRVESIQVRVGFWPLLRGQLEVREVTLTHPELRIVRGTDGRFNLASLGASTSGPAVPMSGGGSGAASALAAVSLAGLSIREGVIVYESGPPPHPTLVTVDRLAASLAQVAVGQTAAVDASARWKEADAPVLLKGTAGPLDARGRPSEVHVVAEIGKSRILMAGKTEGERLSLSAQTDRLDLGQLAEIARRFAPVMNDVNLSGEARVNASVTIEGSRSPSYTVSATVANGRIAGFGLPHPLDHVEGAATLTDDRVAIDRLAVRAGGSDVSISGSLTNATTLQGAFALASSRLDLAELMPPAVPVRPGPTHTSAAPQPSSGGIGKSAPPSPSAGPEIPASVRTASIRLTVDVKTLVGPFLPDFTDLKGVAIMERGGIRLENFKANVYQGIATASGRIDPFGPRPAFDVRASADGVQVAPALAQLTSLKDVVAGRAVAHMTLAGSGATWEAIAPTLSGRGDVAITDGRIRNLNVLKEVVGKDAAGLAADLLTDRPETVFQRLATKVEVRDGALHLTDTVLAAGGYSVTAQGTIGFDHSIDMLGRLSLPKDKAEHLSKTALGAILGTSADGRFDIPVVLSGRLPNPTVRLDQAKAIDTASRRLREKLKERLRGVLVPPSPGTSP